MHILQAKSGLFLFVLVLSFVHDFWLGPRMLERRQQARLAGEPPPQSLARKLVLMTARINLLVVLTIVVLALLLFRP